MEQFEKSISFFKEGKFQEALVQINECIEKDKGNAEYLFFRARVSSRLGSYESALNDFDLLISKEPFNPTYISDRAVVLHLLNRNQEAMEAFDRALNLEPLNPYRYSSRAYFRDRIGDLHGAIEDYEKAIDIDPEDAVAYNNKGLVEEKLGYIQKSKKSFKKADDLVGYKPKFNDTSDNGALQKNGSSVPEVPKNDLYTSESPTKKMNLTYFWKTFKSILFDRNTQKEFLNFIKSGFKRKSPKPS